MLSPYVRRFESVLGSPLKDGYVSRQEAAFMEVYSKASRSTRRKLWETPVVRSAFDAIQIMAKTGRVVERIAARDVLRLLEREIPKELKVGLENYFK